MKKIAQLLSKSLEKQANKVDEQPIKGWTGAPTIPQELKK